MKRSILVAFLAAALLIPQGCTLLAGNALQDYQDIRNIIRERIKQKNEAVIRWQIAGEQLYASYMNAQSARLTALIAAGESDKAAAAFKRLMAFHKENRPSILDTYLAYKRILDGDDPPPKKAPGRPGVASEALEPIPAAKAPPGPSGGNPAIDPGGPAP